MDGSGLSSIGTSIKLIALFGLAFVAHRIFGIAVSMRGMRGRYTDIPGLPRHWLWGNLVNCGQKLAPSLNRHPDYGFEEIWEELDRPSCFHMDLVPVEAGFLIVADPYVAEQLVQPSKEYKYSLPKSETAIQSLRPLIGAESIIVAEGEEWRNLRKRFNKGFQPSHLHTLNPLLTEKTQAFLDRLELAAAKNETFMLKELAQDLTTDIITQMVIEEDFKSQSTTPGTGPKSRFGVLTALHNLSSLTTTPGQGIQLLKWLDPIRPTKEYLYEQVFNRHIHQTLISKLDAENQHPPDLNSTSAGKAIVQLALAGLEPTPALHANTVSQIKSFLFAGQDTVATTIQWMSFELSKASTSPRHAEILRSLREEHTAVFGPEPFSALATLRSSSTNSESIQNSQLPYTTAFIKETLRLHPPAGTARRVPRAGTPLPDGTIAPPVSITFTPSSSPVRIDGLRIYASHWLIHRSSEVWGPNSHTFDPSRWLDASYMDALPPGAFRPFERGPRNCIGQELAMMELKVVLCAVVRGFEFEKVGLRGIEGEREVWNVNRVTSVPCDGMRMKVKRVGR